jgi:hypothetical protein
VAEGILYTLFNYSRLAETNARAPKAEPRFGIVATVPPAPMPNTGHVTLISMLIELRRLGLNRMVFVNYMRAMILKLIPWLLFELHFSANAIPMFQWRTYPW